MLVLLLFMVVSLLEDKRLRRQAYQCHACESRHGLVVMLVISAVATLKLNDRRP